MFVWETKVVIKRIADDFQKPWIKWIAGTVFQDDIEFAFELGRKESDDRLYRIRQGQSLYVYNAEEGTVWFDFLVRSRSNFVNAYGPSP